MEGSFVKAAAISGGLIADMSTPRCSGTSSPNGAPSTRALTRSGKRAATVAANHPPSEWPTSTVRLIPSASSTSHTFSASASRPYERWLEFGGPVPRPQRRDQPEVLGEWFEAVKALDDPTAVEEDHRFAVPGRQILRGPADYVDHVARQAHAPTSRGSRYSRIVSAWSMNIGGTLKVWPSSSDCSSIVHSWGFDHAYSKSAPPGVRL